MKLISNLARWSSLLFLAGDAVAQFVTVGDENPIEVRRLTTKQQCVMPACRNPCPYGICKDNELCVTRSTKLSNGCPGCQKFVRCEKFCPPVNCLVDPCSVSNCTIPKICVAKNTTQANGCPGCPTFDRCQECLIPPCAYPCDLCELEETCRLEHTESFPGCPGCPRFIGCQKPCPPPPQCNVPCGLCGKGAICITEPSEISPGCPGCPVFKGCKRPKRMQTTHVSG